MVDIASALQSPNVFGGFMAGRQARQDEQSTQMRNALMQQQTQQQQLEFEQQQQNMAKQEQYNALLGQYLGPQAASLAAQPGQPGQAPQMQAAAPDQNALLGQLYQLNPQATAQAVQFQQAQQQIQQQQQAEEAKKKVLQAQYILQSQSPLNLARVGFPEEMSAYKQAGADLDNWTDDDAKRAAQAVIDHYAPIAGIAPATAGKEAFTLGEGQTRFDAQGRQIASVAGDPSKKDPTDKSFTRANVLRDEFTAAIKDYGVVKSSYDTIKATAAQPSAAGDISLITAYMKMLDPASTVREGEFNTAQFAASVPERLKGAYNKILSGERLSDEQRKDFVAQAGNVLKPRQTAYQQNKNKYTTLAKRASVDPIDVVGEEEVITAAPAPGPQAPPTIGAVQQGYRFKGGDPASPSSWERM